MQIIFLIFSSLLFSGLMLYGTQKFEFYNAVYNSSQGEIATYWRTNVQGISQEINNNNVEIMAKPHQITMRFIPNHCFKDMHGKVLIGHFLESHTQHRKYITIYRHFLVPKKSNFSSSNIIIEEPTLIIKKFLIALLNDFINDPYVLLRKSVDQEQRKHILNQIKTYNACFLRSNL